MVAASRLAKCVSLVAVATTLAGCGGGGSSPSPSPKPSPSPSPTPSPTPSPAPTPTPPTPAPGPVACSDEMKRGHCTQCFYDKGYTCKACSDPYALNAVQSPGADDYCVFDCKNFKPVDRPAYPKLATQHNGVEWPGMCIDESVSHFFTIGDWGGFCDWNDKNTCVTGAVSPTCGYLYGASAKPGAPCPMPNRGGGTGPFMKEIEGRIQNIISDRMMQRVTELAKDNMAPRFMLNVGDNFYPGGIDSHCGNADMSATSHQFQFMWKNVYPGPLTDIPWMGVLGNHDYGGICYLKGWDQQIYYTWHSQDKWIMPGQFWHTKVQYKNFRLDMWFVDGNIYDASTSVGIAHDICNPVTNPGAHCETKYWPPTAGQDPSSCGAEGPANGQACYVWFQNLWDENYNFLVNNVPKSEAEWQFVINHYPAQYNVGQAGKNYMDWAKCLSPMGVDLYISGHTHEQKVYYGDVGPSLNMGDTPWVITGGGGGVTSETIPMPDGDDDAYGYMDVEISLHSLLIKAYSHGGTQGATIIRNVTKTKPVHSNHELLFAGCTKANLAGKKTEAEVVV